VAGSAMSFTYDEGYDAVGQFGGVKKVLVSWTSDDTTGAVTGATRKIVGTLVKAITDPGATAPSDDYDIAITDEEGADVLGTSVAGLGNRDTANTEVRYFNLTDGTAAIAAFPIVCDVLTIAVTNAGNSKTGQLILYYKPG
jgi:hypothetical protein